MEGIAMSQIDELLKQNEFDIYSNPHVEENKLKVIATIFSEREYLELLDYCKLAKCTSKQCWNNYVSIIDYMKYPQKLNGIPILFEFLKDINWPIFEKAIKVLESYPRKDILPAVEYYVVKAHEEEDDMWISGILLLVQQLNIQPSELKNQEQYDYFQFNDIY